MKVTLNWIKEFIDTSSLENGFDASDIVKILTMSGTEVKKVEDIGSKFKNIVIGRVIEFMQHPDAEKLSVCRVDIGNNILNIVCGAKNFASGDKVAVALEGSVTAQGMAISRSKLRGVVSEGMLCSEYELGLSDESEGIMILNRNCTIGDSFAGSLGLNDIVLELEITPNRPDCLSIMGIAREISVLKGIPLKPLKYEVAGELNPDKNFEIDIKDFDLCPRYSAKVFSHIPLLESPDWLKNRLIMCDYRPINLIVDLTNYVMHEVGQPLHAFDIDLLYSNRVIIRHAKKGEDIRSIDDSIRNLSGEMLVIADEKKPVAIAGVMGGKDTEINENTVNVLLESANFSGPSIMKTSAELGLRSEASNRFEKKIDPELTVVAIKKFEGMLESITGMKISPGIYDCYKKVERARDILLRMAKVSGVLGKEIHPEEVSSILTGLGIENKPGISGTEAPETAVIVARVPSSRYEDLEREIDLIEEIARIHGFENFKSNPMISPLRKGKYTFTQKALKKVRQALSDAGLNEVINYSFISEEWIKRFKLDQEEDRYSKAVRILNPLNEDFAFLRTTPIPLMVKNIIGNFNHGIKDISIFEVTKVYEDIPGAKLPDEKTVLGVMLSGRSSVKTWDKNEKAFDYYDIKGMLEYLCSIFYKNAVLRVTHKEIKFFHPAISGEIVINGKVMGIIGKIHPVINDDLDISQDIYYLELNLDVFISSIDYSMDFKSITQFPSIDIDIALVVDREIRHEDIETEIRKEGTKILNSLQLFDIYSGKQVGEGKKSMAYSLSFQEDNRTLKDTEVEIIVKRILENLARKFGAKLRD